MNSPACCEIFTARLCNHFPRFSIAASSQSFVPRFTNRLFRKRTLWSARVFRMLGHGAFDNEFRCPLTSVRLPMV